MREQFQKAAMFGLDARIALAIFGSLSAIAGIALYSAVENAKATALLADMQEVGKAFEQYYLDTGTYPPRVESVDSTSIDFYRYKLVYLIDDYSVADWKGPYLSSPPNGGITLKGNNYCKFISIDILTGQETWGGVTTFSLGKCTAGYQCQAWVMASGVESESLAKKMDIKVDNGDGADAGNFRWWYSNDGNEWRYHLKYVTVPNPNS